MMRLVAIAPLYLLGCSAPGSGDLANYQFNAPMAEVSAGLAALATAHSTLGRIGVQRPALHVQSSFASELGHVAIVVPGEAGRHEVTLNFRLTPCLEGKATMVALTMDAPDMGEIDLGPGRFAGRKSLGKEMAAALGALAGRTNHLGAHESTANPFERLFDLAAVLDNPQLRTLVLRRGKQEGAVDFLFAAPPVVRGFDDPPD